MTQRVLYIDDDEGLRRITARSLGRRGYEVVTAESGAAGVALAAESQFDIVAVDHYMPGQDGLETLAMLIELPYRPPIVYVTGSEESRIAVAAMKAGATDYVVKTIGDDFFDLLSTTFAQAIERRQLRIDKEEAEQSLLATNERLEALLKEVNHRVANSLQIVSSFVQMQASGLSEPSAKAALLDTQRRILAIAQVHRRLYTSDEVNHVDMVDYLTALLEELEETWTSPAAPRFLKLSVDPLRLKTDMAVSVGVIVNELVSNACKYAYDPESPGEVRVFLTKAGEDGFELRVEDDGRGFAADGTARGTGLGRRLMGAMAHSLKSEVVYEPVPTGVRAVLKAPL